jgi:hypothetical protein
VPETTPQAWRDRWAGEAARYGQAPVPETFDDPPMPTDPSDARAIERTVNSVRAAVLPLLEAARSRG